MRKMLEIIRLIKEKKSLKTDKEVAELLGIEPDTFHMQKKRESIPFVEIAAFCVRENISLDWLLLGNREPNVEHVNIADHNGFCDDLRYHDICEYLRENPDDRDAIHELIQAKRAARKATENFLKGK